MMLSVFRSLVRPRTVVSLAAFGSRRNLMVTTKICKQYKTMKPIESSEDEKDLLRGTINGVGSIGHLQSVFEQHNHVMNSIHLLHCMHQYVNLVKQEEPHDPAEDDPFFQSLSQKVLTKIRYFGHRECIQLLGIAARLKLNASCSLVQAISQMLRKQLNELDIHQTTVLQRHLKELEGTSVLTDTLALSLPLVFENQVDRELDPENFEMCKRAFLVVLKSDVKLMTRRNVAEAFSRFLPRLSADDAINIIYAAGFQKRSERRPIDPEVRSILQECMKIVASDMSQFDPKSVRRILAAYQELDIESRPLMEACWNLAPSRNIVEVMILASVAVDSDSLLIKDAERLRDLILSRHTEVVDFAHPTQLRASAEAMSMLALHSPHLDSRLTEVGNIIVSSLKRTGVSEIKLQFFASLMLYLATLGVYPEHELSLLFSESSQTRLMSESSHYTLERLLDLERLLHLRFGDACAYVVLPELREFVMRARNPLRISEVVEKALEAALGGDQFILRRVKTPLGVEIDLAVVMRPGGYPITVPNKAYPLEDLPKDCKVLGILQCFSRRDFTRAHDAYRIHVPLKVNFLRAQNICPLLIDMEQMFKLAPNERTPHIMTKIKDALDEGSSYSEQEAKESETCKY